ncbi:putative quinol monooxygenase [Marinobacter sp. OP 3.4]|uniref:putative quinol monooxygenase n=1 Tax=Marinobacter sp. OP 3.4 TaxID=3076501 RepID=UPI002E1FE4A3
MPGIVLRGHIVVPLHDLEPVLQELPVHIELTRKEPGCLIFDVNQDSEVSTIFHVYEEFIDRQAFEAHQHRVQNSNWGRAAASIERHYTIHEID